MYLNLITLATFPKEGLITWHNRHSIKLIRSWSKDVTRSTLGLSITKRDNGSEFFPTVATGGRGPIFVTEYLASMFKSAFVAT